MNVGLNLMCNCAIRIYCSMLVAVVPSYLRRCETVSLQYLQLLLFCSPCCNYQLSVRFLLRFELQAELLMKSHQRPTQPGSDAHWDWDTGHVLFYCPAWLNQEAARLIICQFHLFQYFFFFIYHDGCGVLPLHFKVTEVCVCMILPYELSSSLPECLTRDPLNV